MRFSQCIVASAATFSVVNGLNILISVSVFSFTFWDCSDRLRTMMDLESRIFVRCTRLSRLLDTMSTLSLLHPTRVEWVDELCSQIRGN
jgi:hypothetical protein